MKKMLNPVFEDNYVTIATSSSDLYLPYLSVWVQSIVNSSSQKHNYDIIIFSIGKDDITKNQIIKRYSSKNISIRFFDPTTFLDNINMVVTHANFDIACYFRLVAPVALNYKRVLFTDCDLCFIKDVYDIKEVDVENVPMACCVDKIWCKLVEKKTPLMNTPDIIKYSQKTLKLQDINKYFNTGVVWMNLDAFRKNGYFNQLKDLLKNTYFVFQEQCALNRLINNETKVLEPEWNYQIIDIIPNYCDEEKIRILHWPGLGKPWFYPNVEYAYIWWHYARQTPFYEEILARLLDFKVSQRPFDYHAIYMLIHPTYFRLKKLCYCLLKHITLGKKREIYKEKYCTLKTQMKAVKRIIINEKK